MKKMLKNLYNNNYYFLFSPVKSYADSAGFDLWLSKFKITAKQSTEYQKQLRK